MAGQGSLLAFVILIFALAHFQNKIDEEEGMAEDEE
jgi:putative solute:sodium symporter small subunit